MPFQDTVLNVHGTRTQLLTGGSGDPLLYLRSAGGEVVWLPFFELLSQHYTVYVPAHPGFSKSDGKAYQEGIAGAKFVSLEKCGHAPPFEKPEETVKLLAEFFQA